MSIISKIYKILGVSSQEALAMAYSRKKALETLSDQISDHLFLLVHYPKNEAYKGWLRELNGWSILLSRRHKGLKGKKNYDKKMLMNVLWREPLGEEADRKGALRWAVEIKDLPEVKINASLLKDAVEKFCDSVLNNTTFKI